jgi:hypothetical protein
MKYLLQAKSFFGSSVEILFSNLDEATSHGDNLLHNDWDEVSIIEVPDSYATDIVKEISSLEVVDNVVIPTFH